MRTGVSTVHQALTTEAASVLKLSLNLAKRRGHAQVTPLHVATTLLTSSLSSPSLSSSNLLKRACLKSKQNPNNINTTSHLLHCRALELCFNVALNRLPTCTSSSSSNSNSPNGNSLMHSYPTLSNALIAALKRAQANQRRGCIELQQQQQQNQIQQNQQQNQPLLAIKVELDQLIISILDDPSVSRVMREAGFSSTAVKGSLEEERESSVLGLGTKELWPTQFMKPLFEQDPFSVFSQKEDLRVIFEVMVGKKGRKKSNPVIVGDSVSVAAGLVDELKKRLERENVPDELKRVHFLKFCSNTYMQLGLMGKSELEMKVSELRRNVTSLGLDRGTNMGVVIYLGDLKWAIGEDTKDGILGLGLGFSPVDYIVDEIGKVVFELKNSVNSGDKVWIMSVASYQTYMEVKRKRPFLESKWGLHAVTVPSAGLALSLQSPVPSGLEPRITKLAQSPFQVLELPKTLFSFKEEEREEENGVLCFECTANYERESSLLVNSENRGFLLPAWLQPHKPERIHKENLMELRRKWTRLCQKLHQFRNNNSHFYPPLFNSTLNPWWSSPCNQNKPLIEPNPISFTRTGSNQYPFELNLSPFKENINQDLKTNTTTSPAILLGGLFPLSDSATSDDKQNKGHSVLQRQELEKRLRENIPWQSSSIDSITQAFVSCRDSSSNGEKKGNWVLIEGSDHIAKRRVALVLAEIYFGSTDKLVRVDSSEFASSGALFDEIITKGSEKESKCVVLIEGIDQLPENFINSFDSSTILSESVVCLSTSSSGSDTILKTGSNTSCNNVLKLRFLVEESPLPSDNHDLKRKKSLEIESENRLKRPKLGEHGLDLNLCAKEEEEEEEEKVSDLTHEGDGIDRPTNLSYKLLETISARVTLEAGRDNYRRISDGIVSRLEKAFGEVSGFGEGQFGNFVVDEGVIEGLVGAYSSCLETVFERWVREVFQIFIPTVKNGGKVRLGLVGLEGIEEGGRETESGFCGSVLPRKICVD